MKTGVIEKPGTLAMMERDEPKLKNPGGALIKVTRVGICGSDIHIYHGKNPFAVYPRVWGHEFVGEVLETGGAVENTRKGDRVVVEPIISCGTCYACRQGRGNVCEKLQVMGVHIDGGCQEYIVVPAAAVHVLPAGLPWEEAVLIEPFTIGAQAAYRANIRNGDLALILGAGTIGLTALTMAKLAGAEVIAVDIVEHKLAYAKSRGAEHTINAARENVEERVKEISGGMMANVVVDAVCNKKSFEDAVQLCSAAGRVVELSFNEIPSEIAPLRIIKNEISVYGSRLQTKRFPVVIDYIRQGKLPLAGFVSRSYPVDDMAEAFDYVEKNSAAVRKVIISFE
ncbi:MAG: zinc-binding alcohol dehydrogenase family protein [Treponema sp.]|jgi:L-gulonate 5-dehydrogenase|nr:zinc-binding alcohol dehydrogenase family protein [Treponema sp.]